MKSNTRNSPAALQWIVSELNRRNVPFAIVGGMAAMAYGGSRPLNDIDIDVPVGALALLAQELHVHCTSGPELCVSECFESQLLCLWYEGQEIELSGADSIKIFDREAASWLPWPTDLAAVEQRQIFGITVPVMNRQALIAYKKLAGRETDLIDVRELEGVD